MDGTLRLFIAIQLPPPVQAALAAARARLEAHALAVRWVDPAGAHLTLKFLGAAPREQVEAIVAATQEATRLHRPFTLTTTRLGLFPGPKEPRVIWLGVGGALAELQSLRDDVERFVAPLGYPTERRPFNPHLTLGRTAKGAGRSQLAAIGPAVAAAPEAAPVAWPVSTVNVMRSELLAGGARYTPVARLDLDSAGAAAIIPPVDEPDGPPMH